MKTTIIKYMTLVILLLLTVGLAGCDDDKDKEDICYIGKVVSHNDEYVMLIIVDAPPISTDNIDYPREGWHAGFFKSDLPNQVFEDDMLISFQITHSELFVDLMPIYGEKYNYYKCEVKPCH